MGIKRINKEEPFVVPADKFIISASTSGYTLNYSADGITYTAWEEATASNSNQVVIGLPANSFVKLVGNTADNILIRW